VQPFRSFSSSVPILRWMIRLSSVNSFQRTTEA
jgi:hypothetical protein